MYDLLMAYSWTAEWSLGLDQCKAGLNGKVHMLLIRHILKEMR